MNIRRGRAKYENFQLLLDSECSSMILIRILATKLKLKKIM